MSEQDDLPTLFCVHRHCNFCRRAHGAAFVAWFGVPEARFGFLKVEAPGTAPGRFALTVAPFEE